MTDYPKELTETLTLGMPSPVSHWKMNETSGTAMVDSIGSYEGLNNNLTINQSGKIDKSYLFNDSISTVGKIPLNSGPFSIAVWVKYTIKPDNDDNHQIINLNWDWGNYLGYGYQIEHLNGANGKQNIYFGRDTYQSNSAVPAGEWHHLVITHDGTTGTFYLDGVADGSFEHIPMADAEVGHIGKEAGSPPNWRDFRGSMDDLRVYQDTLTSTEISEVYNSGTGTEAEVPASLLSFSLQKTLSENITLSDGDTKVWVHEMEFIETLSLTDVGAILKDGGDILVSLNIVKPVLVSTISGDYSI